MTWTCPAISNGVAIYDDGKIRPCCKVNWAYSKPISEISNPNRFSDIDYEQHCGGCLHNERLGIRSYRKHFIGLDNGVETTNIKFLDLRNSNLCNAKCRNCGPHHSSKWHQEQTGVIEIRQTDISDSIIDTVMSNDLIHIYIAGGEPLLVKSNFDLIARCVELGISKNVLLMYNTNLSTLSYKDKNYLDLWPQFKQVDVFGSADGVGELYNAMRSDLNWETYLNNVEMLMQHGIKYSYHLTVSNLNIWFLDDIVRYVRDKKWNLIIDIVFGPEELSLPCIPAKLIPKAKDIINNCEKLLPPGTYEDLISRLTGDGLVDFNKTLEQQKHYDSLRGENLIELLKSKGIE
jgi:sulfatase maturation enzyme AslB (radical SAM superfamily)